MTTSTIQNKKYNLPAKAGAMLFWLLLWQAASMALHQEILLVSPIAAAKRLWELIFTAIFWQSILFTFGRIIAGFLAGLFLGSVLAVAAYLFRSIKILFHPLMSVIKATPVASFIILCLIWIPSKNLSVFTSFLMILPVVYTNLLNGLEHTDRKLLEMASVFQISKWKKAVYIYFSELQPYLISACSISLGLCWKAGVAAEVIGVPAGSIGEKLYNAKVYLNTPDLFAWTIVIIVISYFFEKLFLWLLKTTASLLERR